MRKAQANFIIDVLMFLCMATLGGTGFLIKYTLLPGREAWVKFGANVELSFVGMDRHEWGSVHLALSLVFLALLILHVVLHRKLTVSMYRATVKSGNARWIATILFLVVCAILSLFALAVKPQVRTIKRGEGRRMRSESLQIEERGIRRAARGAWRRPFAGSAGSDEAADVLPRRTSALWDAETSQAQALAEHNISLAQYHLPIGEKQ